ncbi:hypothetical protein CC80DRAFT_513997 [Byssothecium circinans]|uniref:Pentacotripeptide-repeat region of PRORP domain-containing protein n=1 Tax=Byssothecium circinans TaxID=147558 RepID=A0A6A5U6C7_9PLEO|nr:hypothetical protein CC80DRAFT_513997 [Byssothecium circinans]
MSLLRTLDRTSAVSNPSHARPLLTFLYPVLCKNDPSRRKFSKSSVNSPPRVTRTSTESMDSFFIQALVRAGSCPEHAKQISTLPHAFPFPMATKHHKTRRKNILHNKERREYKSAKVLKGRGPIKRAQHFAEEELKALVDYYGIDLEAQTIEETTEDDGPLIWNVGDDHEPWPFKSPKDREAAQKLEEMLKDEETPHHRVFGTYKELPAPGVVYLHIAVIRNMLHHLSVLERPTPIAMQRFLSILDDMKNAHIRITRFEWTTAIYLTGRFMGTVTADEVQSALHLWRDMEKRANVRGGIVTMNVLFDIAVKAGKYTLAETFLKEMQARKLKPHRHFRVSLIYYYGVQQNGNGVRKAYTDLVSAGDIVDTVVMNAVIAALIRAGEPSAAEQVFERMKRLHASKSNILPNRLPFNTRMWRGSRHLGLHFTHTAILHNRANATEKLKELQDMAPIAPNSRTYGILIRHYARAAGDMDRVIDLLRDMGYNAVPVEGTIFIAMFHGFQRFGGVRYSSWTLSRMEQTWQEYLEAVRNGLDRTWVSRMAVVSALRAFAKFGERERMLRAWDEVREVWDPEERDVESVMRVLGGTLSTTFALAFAFAFSVCVCVSAFVSVSLPPPPLSSSSSGILRNRKERNDQPEISAGCARHHSRVVVRAEVRLCTEGGDGVSEAGDGAGGEARKRSKMRRA